MAIQYPAIVEETTRGTDPGSGYLFLPVMNNIQPTVKYDDQARKEFRGADTALGDSTVVRRSGQWSMTIECAYYPGAETGLFFKHCLGKAGTRSTLDTSDKEGILYPLANLYGTGANLQPRQSASSPTPMKVALLKASIMAAGGLSPLPSRARVRTM